MSVCLACARCKKCDSKDLLVTISVTKDLKSGKHIKQVYTFECKQCKNTWKKVEK